MKVAVTGSREFTDRQFVFEQLDEIKRTHSITLLIHGAATGVDSLARDWADARGIPSKAFPVTREDWQRYGMSAGPRRNAIMLEELPAYVIAFPGGRGTANMRNQAAKKGVPIVLVVYDEEKRGDLSEDETASKPSRARPQAAIGDGQSGHPLATNRNRSAGQGERREDLPEPFEKTGAERGQED